MPIDLNALAYFVETTFDYDEAYEDDCFGVKWEGVVLYVERRSDHFLIELPKQMVEIPR